MATRDRRRYAQVQGSSIATTSTTDEYITAPVNGILSEALITPLAALAAHDSNYITWTLTNLGQDGNGTNAMLAATDPNTTKATGGSALSANTKRALILNGTMSNRRVKAGDRIRIRATATGTLAGAVTKPVYALTFLKEL